MFLYRPTVFFVMSWVATALTGTWLSMGRSHMAYPPIGGFPKVLSATPDFVPQVSHAILQELFLMPPLSSVSHEYLLEAPQG
jgi:hypothetical protein